MQEFGITVLGSRFLVLFPLGLKVLLFSAVGTFFFFTL